MKIKARVDSATRELQIALDSLTAERDRTAALEQRVVMDRKLHAALEVLLIGRQAAEADVLKRLRKSETEREMLSARVARLATELAAVGVERDNMSAQMSKLRSEAAQAVRHREDALAEAVLLTERSEALRRESELAGAFAEESWLAGQRATAIIGAVLGEQSGFWQKVGELLGHRRLSRIREKLENASQILTKRRVTEFSPHRTVEEHGAPPHNGALLSGRNPYLRAESLIELLSWQDVDFVRCAYVTLLGRQPEPDGEATYLARLRDGYSKLTIAVQLRFSSEGRRHDPGIVGLDRQLRRHRNATRMLTGWFVRAVTDREGDTRSERESRRLQAQIRRSDDEQIHVALGYADTVRELRQTLCALSKSFELKSAATSEHIQNLAALISPVQNATEKIQSAQSQIEGRLDSLSATLRDIESELVESKQPFTIEDILQTFETDVNA